MLNRQILLVSILGNFENSTKNMHFDFRLERVNPILVITFTVFNEKLNWTLLKVHRFLGLILKTNRKLDMKEKIMELNTNRCLIH